MTEVPDFFPNALEKTTQRMMLFDGRVYEAFDDLDTGLRARRIVEWWNERTAAVFEDLTGKAFGAALSVAMIAVEADRRYRRMAEVEFAEDAWRVDEEWQARVEGEYDAAGAEPGMCPQAWRRSPLQALLGRERLGAGGDLRWHLSVAHMERIPTWEELVEVAHQLRPGVPFVLGLPPRSWWLNYDERVLHLWESRDAELIDTWRRAGRGDEPT